MVLCQGRRGGGLLTAHLLAGQGLPSTSEESPDPLQQPSSGLVSRQEDSEARRTGLQDPQQSTLCL